MLHFTNSGLAPFSPPTLPVERQARVPLLHPVLLAIFPILSLYEHNMKETPLQELWEPLALVVAGVVLIWGGLRWWTGDPFRSALTTSLLAALFFVFDLLTQGMNQVLGLIGRLLGRGIAPIHPLPMLILMTVLTVLALALIWRRLTEPTRWNRYLNIFSLILVALPLSSVTLAKMANAGTSRPLPIDPWTLHPKTDHRPDIYYIILDAYASADNMKDLFNFDNSSFLNRLEHKGFYVARQSRANYCQTRLSLCSSLNGDYLSNLVSPSARDLTSITPMIGKNRVVESLRPLGYRFVTFSTGYEPTEHPEADIYLAPRKATTAFHRRLIYMTPFWFLLTKATARDYFHSARERTLYTLDQLPSIASIKEPTFTFAHILCPHPPFVFGERGDDVSPRRGNLSLVDMGRYTKRYNHPEGYRKGYCDQAKFVTREIERAIERIIAASAEPPIIILQSDHGSGLLHHVDDPDQTNMHERMGILNCYYVPPSARVNLHEAITPVNSFRVLFNNLFDASLPLLEERNYFSTFQNPLQFTDVTDRYNEDEANLNKSVPPSAYDGLTP